MSEPIRHCDGCGRWRDGEWIGEVFARTLSFAVQFPVDIRAHYCLDDMRCLETVAGVLDERVAKLINGQCPPAIHCLVHGFAVCRQLRGVPAQWPSGHSWVALVDKDKVTCVLCRARLELEAGRGNEGPQP